MPGDAPRILARGRRERAATGQVADRDDLAVERDDRQLRPQPRQHAALLKPLAQRPVMCRPGGPERSARRTRLDRERTQLTFASQEARRRRDVAERQLEEQLRLAVEANDTVRQESTV